MDLTKNHPIALNFSATSALFLKKAVTFFVRSFLQPIFTFNGFIFGWIHFSINSPTHIPPKYLFIDMVWDGFSMNWGWILKVLSLWERSVVYRVWNLLRSKWSTWSWQKQIGSVWEYWWVAERKAFRNTDPSCEGRSIWGAHVKQSATPIHSKHPVRHARTFVKFLYLHSTHASLYLSLWKE